MNSSTPPSYSLQIIVKSAESLTIEKHKCISKNVFVTISTENQASQIQTRLCDQDNKARPTWNEEFPMVMPMNTKYLYLEVFYQKKSRKKLIGTAKVPTSDFIGNKIMPINYLHCLCYRLRDNDGEPNGVISFSVKVTGLKGTSLDSHYDGNQNYNREAIEIQGFGYNRETHYYGQKPWIGTSLLSGRRNPTTAAVGIPVAWYNSCHASLL